VWGGIHDLLCIELKRSLSLLLNMDCEELLKNLLAEPREQPPAAQREQPQTSDVSRKRVRLAALACGGHAMHFKGRLVTPERTDAMEAIEIEELHARHEARFGAAMSKSLGSTLLRCVKASTLTSLSAA